MSDSDSPIEPKPTLERFVRVPPSAELRGLEGAAKGHKFRLEAHATLGRSPESTIMIDDPEVSRAHASLTRTGVGYEIEDLKSRNGTFVNGTRVEKHLLAPSDKVRLGPHSVLEFQAVDITEDALIQRQRFETVGRFGVGTAHDLKNLLAALGAGVSFLRDSPATLPLGNVEVRACLTDLHQALERASELTRDLLSLTQGRASDRGPLDLADLIGTTVTMVKRTLGREIQVDLSLPRALYVHGSRSELQQVLLNLLLNARDAMPQGGRLLIALEPEGDTGGPAGARRERSLARLRVADTGVGMDPATQARIFDRHFTTKREGTGFGLGLAMVQEVISDHGGRIEVESAVGAGTVFILHLPSLDEEAVRLVSTAQRTKPPERPPPISVKRVLIVDDEAVLRRGLTRLLTVSGFTTAEAADGTAALAAYRAERPGLVLLDFGLPGSDGLETLKALRELDPEARVLITTGLGGPERQALARAHGALGLLEKPFTLNALLAAMSQAADFEPPTRPA